MNRPSWWRWTFVAVWAAWLMAGQGFIAARSSHGAWVPDLSLVLMLSLSAHIARADLLALAVAFAFARTAISIEPPIAVVAAYLGVTFVVRTASAVIEIGSATPRCLLAAGVTLGLAAWFELVHRVRDARELVGGARELVLDGLGFDVLAANWPSALSTALAALLAAPLLARLPGLTFLWKKRPWHAAASPR